MKNVSIKTGLLENRWMISIIGKSISEKLEYNVK